MGFRETYRRIFSKEAEMWRTLGNPRTLLDLGCGKDSPVRPFCRGLYSVGADIFEPYLAENRREGHHEHYVAADASDLCFKDSSFECVMASDVLEHLTKEGGLKMIAEMERVASDRVVIFTPNGFLKQDSYDDNPYQEHLSGWDVEEFEERGYEVIGINGYWRLRGDFAIPRYRPEVLWRRISNITQLFTRDHPRFAYQLLCVKNLR